MNSRPLLLLLCLVALHLPAAAGATPVLTTFAQFSVGPSTDADGPQTGGSLSSSVTTTAGASQCGITGTCSGGANPSAHATAAQNETVFGTFSGLVADATFFNGSSSRVSLLARTTWEDSPALAGPTSISLLIKPGQLILSDFNGLSTTSPVPIELRFAIELSVAGTRVFFSEAILRGGKNGATLTENGTDLGGTFVADGDFPDNVKGFAFDPFLTTLSLGDLTPSDVVRYVMEVSVSGPGFETGGRAQIGDPFDLSGGGSGIAFVPEPSAGALLGLAGLVARRARRS